MEFDRRVGEGSIGDGPSRRFSGRPGTWGRMRLARESRVMSRSGRAEFSSVTRCKLGACARAVRRPRESGVPQFVWKGGHFPMADLLRELAGIWVPKRPVIRWSLRPVCPRCRPAPIVFRRPIFLPFSMARERPRAPSGGGV